MLRPMIHLTRCITVLDSIHDLQLTTRLQTDASRNTNTTLGTTVSRRIAKMVHGTQQ